MTPDRREPIPQDVRDILDAARPDQIRRLLADILSGQVRIGDPRPTHAPANKGRLN
jgi:hypothetical protein